jgi:hypothetical protein
MIENKNGFQDKQLDYTLAQKMRQYVAGDSGCVNFSGGFCFQLNGTKNAVSE